MKKYLILGPNYKGKMIVDSKYRGIDRIVLPEIPKDPWKASAINLAIEEFMNNTDVSVKDGEYLKEYTHANRLAEIYTLNNEKGDLFEVIEVVYPGETPSDGRKFLGYDVLITNEFGSLIVNFFGTQKNNSNLNSEISKYIGLLNENFLFSDVKLAQEFCHEAKKILGKQMEFGIVGIYI